MDKETRIALVLSGGASLATYIYGISKELLNIVRAEKSEDNIYSELNKVIKSEIVIDLISGTSAGGINGAILSKALTSGADFNESKIDDIWAECANIFRLLFSNFFGASILSGNYMYKNLLKLFVNMDKNKNPEYAKK